MGRSRLRPQLPPTAKWLSSGTCCSQKLGICKLLWWGCVSRSNSKNHFLRDGILDVPGTSEQIRQFSEVANSWRTSRTWSCSAGPAPQLPRSLTELFSAVRSFPKPSWKMSQKVSFISTNLKSCVPYHVLVIKRILSIRARNSKQDRMYA